MTARPGRPVLDAAARKRALEVARKAASRDRQAAPSPVVSDRRNQSFGETTGFLQMNAVLQASETLGIENPYFRVHDGHAMTRTSIQGRELLNFSSYDYLGLNADPRPAEAAVAAIRRYGVSASASRMVAGTRPVHCELETELAAHYGCAAAQTFVSGHATNVSVIAAVVGKGDVILHDAFIHNSVTDGAQMAEASRRSFAHNDMAALERLLAECRAQYRNILVVVEGLYSMDGDLPDLPTLVVLREKYGFWLMVDEAHALGCVGQRGLGSFEHFGIDPSRIDIWMGTLSKTLASTGGYIAGSADLIALLRYMAGGFVFSVAQPPALAASALAALRLLHAEPTRAERLRGVSRHFSEQASALGLDTGTSGHFGVLPVIVGDSTLAVRLSERLFARGINVAPAMFPGVPMGTARLRFFLTAEHTPDQIDTALAAVREELDDLHASGFVESMTAAMARSGLAVPKA